MKKAVIFDLDGTLADSLESITHCGNLALARYGFGPFDREDYKYFVGDGAAMLIRRALLKAGDEELKNFDRVLAAYREVFREGCMYQVKPYEGIVPMLEELKRREIRTAVLSNKPHANSVSVVEGLFGKNMFDCVMGQQEDVPRKPDPAGVYRIEKLLGLEPEDFLYVGDTGVDMKTGKAAGLFTVGVLWGFRNRKELEENHADAIISRPAELPELLWDAGKENQ